MKTNHKYNYDYKEQVMEINTLPSKTIPDMTLSLQQLVQRYTIGQSIDVKQTYYDDTEKMLELIEEYGDITNLKTIERNELLHEIKKRNYYKEELARRDKINIDKQADSIKSDVEQKKRDKEESLKEFDHEISKQRKLPKLDLE